MSIFAFALLIGLFGNSGRASQPRALNYEAVVGPDGMLPPKVSMGK